MVLFVLDYLGKRSQVNLPAEVSSLNALLGFVAETYRVDAKSVVLEVSDAGKRYSLRSVYDFNFLLERFKFQEFIYLYVFYVPDLSACSSPERLEENVEGDAILSVLMDSGIVDRRNVSETTALRSQLFKTYLEDRDRLNLDDDFESKFEESQSSPKVYVERGEHTVKKQFKSTTILPAKEDPSGKLEAYRDPSDIKFPNEGRMVAKCSSIRELTCQKSSTEIAESFPETAKKFKYSMEFLSHESCGNVAPGALIECRWRIRNNGKHSWPPGFKIVKVIGSQVEVISDFLLPEVPKKKTVEVKACLKAPEIPGNYVVQFKICTIDGDLFGARLISAFTVATTDNLFVQSTPSPSEKDGPRLQCSVFETGNANATCSGNRMDGASMPITSEDKKVGSEQQIDDKKFRAEFVKHIRLEPVRGGNIVEKSWTVRNSGMRTWPAGISLVQCTGFANALVSVSQIPEADKNMEVSVNAFLRAPLSPGTYSAYFRLILPDGKLFGPRLHASFNVLESKESEISASVTESDQCKVEEEEEKEKSNRKSSGSSDAPTTSNDLNGTNSVPSNNFSSDASCDTDPLPLPMSTFVVRALVLPLQLVFWAFVIVLTEVVQFFCRMN